MKITIDARLYGHEHAGIGRYVENLIKGLFKKDSINQYHLIFNSKAKIPNLPKNFTSHTTSARHYTLSEQTDFLKLLNSINSDLTHFPHFNVPILYSKPYIVTIHDLLWHEKKGLNVTTLSPIKYLLKYFGYRFTVRNAVKRSQKILVPTNVVKTSLFKYFNLDQKKIIITNEAADPIFSQNVSQEKAAKVSQKYHLKQPFIIYTGSLYPHKNVNTLISSLKYITPDIKLVIASARNVFQQKTHNFTASQNLSKRVKFLGYVPDSDLTALYHQALALVLPSVSEGFGLTGLEAMAAGLPVICSDSKVLKEIYQDVPIYVNSTSEEKLANAITMLHKDKKLQKQKSKLGIKHSQKFSWDNTVDKTLSTYNQFASARQAI